MKSRDRILNAAIPVFARKGRHGAHMEEIAALAHINKAMIYYIFHNKDELYLEVIKFVFHETSTSIAGVTENDIKNGRSYSDVLSNFISAQISFFNDNRNYTKIMVDAMSSGANEIPIAIKYFKENQSNDDPASNLRIIIEKGKKEKFIRDVDTDQLIISIIGMAIIYFFSHSITESLDIEVKDENAFLELRKQSIIDLVLHSVLIHPAESPKKKTIKKKS